VARLGILGGTFNPPHLGHLMCAQEAFDQLGLDGVVLVPVCVPPHKELRDDPGAAHRVALCRAAVTGDERLAVSTLEVERGGASYTVDTLQTLHDLQPEDDLTFIAGGDMARSLPSWREPERIVELAKVAVAEREGVGRQDIADAVGRLGRTDPVVFFDMPRVDVSSSLVRRRIARGRPIRYLVPDAVADYIGRHGLYRAGVGAAR
jgi:nicotinate-nucleotide adenylyltransferase